MALSRGQQQVFFQLAQAAYQIERERAVNEIESFDAWRKQIQKAACGCTSTKAMNRTDDFDAVMLEFAIIAEDEHWMGRLSGAAERRIKWIIEKQYLVDLEYLEQQPIEWKYIEGICQHMRFPTKKEDCPAEMLVRVLQAVDTHVRRLAKRKGIELLDLPSGHFRKGDRATEAKAKWHHDHKHHVTHEVVV